ncbi:Transcription factor tau subunit sfc6 [Grifola frondosa]|uniref:Transcription factor tau subunit sfc6 n=1 Tax=Grifola frondosa TaxID=5627 RepID=A0A1C7LNC4_GRIFR|nr:Transcription factor tau subunit sfc6 [Grifola frondosa]
MTRQLRSRASRPNYAALLQDYADDEAGPSKQTFYEEDSGSDFAPDTAEDKVGQDDHDDLELDEDVEEDTIAPLVRYPSTSERENSIVASISVSDATRKRPSKSQRKKSVALVPGLSRPSARQMYALPSIHHRHRAKGVYQRVGQTQRLTQRPRIFRNDMTTPAKTWASNAAVTDKINKSWGYNVGPGPLWELMEDRAWFKEMLVDEDQSEEKHLRPRRRDTLFPSDVITTDEGALKPPPPVICSFGPFGHQTRVELKMFDAVKMGIDFILCRSLGDSHVFNAGAPVWGLDWCPIHPDDRAHYSYKQYLAVTPFPSRTHSPMIGEQVQRPSPACIQIWALHPTQVAEEAMDVDGGGDNSQDDCGEMRCEMVLCVDSGPAHDLKWCPLPSNDAYQPEESGTRASHRKLGILGGTFEDGSVTLYAVPDPADLKTTDVSDIKNPICVRLPDPLLRIELEETSCWTFDWANSEVIAIGCSIAVYNIAQALKSGPGAASGLLPTHYISVHQSAIRALAWVRAPGVSASGELTRDDPTVIASGGYDGVECLTDIRDLYGNVMNRTRDVINSVCYSTYCGGPITIDHENIVKAYSVSPSMLGRGHTLLEPDGPVWSVGASDYHPQLAIGVTDGTCLTTNTLRSTRRGGSVPFLVHKIYQLDYSRNSGEYRMLERFLPKETQNRPAAIRANKVMPVGTGVWPQEVGVHRVVWNVGNGLGRAPLLASATGSGLCRVDWLLGRWNKDHIPYNGVEGIRGEGADTSDEDDESD